MGGTQVVVMRKGKSGKTTTYDAAFRYTFPPSDPGPEEILYMWEPPTTPRPGAVAWDINSVGQVSLHGMMDTGRQEAFLYTDEHGLLNLSDLVTGDVGPWNAAVALRPFAISEPYEDTGFPLVVLVAVNVSGLGNSLVALLTPESP